MAKAANDMTPKMMETSTTKVRKMPKKSMNTLLPASDLSFSASSTSFWLLMGPDSTV